MRLGEVDLTEEDSTLRIFFVTITRTKTTRNSSSIEIEAKSQDEAVEEAKKYVTPESVRFCLDNDHDIVNDDFQFEASEMYIEEIQI